MTQEEHGLLCTPEWNPTGFNSKS